MVFNEKYLVVIVDNQEDELKKISAVFEDEGYEVNVAMHYEQLLFCLEDEMPDLIIIDFKDDEKMKKEMFLRVRGDQRFLEIPILGIFDELTAETSANYYEMGVDSICSTPYCINIKYSALSSICFNEY